MNYTLNQLRIFYKIAQNQSITKAAEELHLTQPAVSIQLKKFQDQFSIPLTEVVGRRLYITDFGREIAEAAEQIIHQVQAINYKTHAFAGQIKDRRKITKGISSHHNLQRTETTVDQGHCSWVYGAPVHLSNVLWNRYGYSFTKHPYP